MTIGTRIMTWFRGELVGTDPYGNRYFRDKSRRALERGGGRFSRERRWVMYNGAAEASRVPPEWHGWLHHTDRGRAPRGWRPSEICLAEAASAEPHRHALRVSAAGLGAARRRARAFDRRLRGRGAPTRRTASR